MGKFMDKFMEVKHAFGEDKAVRRMVYAAALVMTLINYSISQALISGGSGIVLYLMLGVSAAVTLALYLASDGLEAFALVVKIAVKIGGVFTGIVSFLLCWMMFIGSFFAIFITFLAEAAVIGSALIFAYVFPVVFIPLFHHVTRFGKFISTKAAARQSIDSDGIYQKAADGIEG